MDLQRWDHLSIEFQELIHSSYWNYLPKEIQLKILSLLDEDVNKLEVDFHSEDDGFFSSLNLDVMS